MTRSFPLNKKRMASKGVLPIMCFNCLKRFGTLRIDVVARGRGSICVTKEVSVRIGPTHKSKSYSVTLGSEIRVCCNVLMGRIGQLRNIPNVTKGLFAVANRQLFENAQNEPRHNHCSHHARRQGCGPSEAYENRMHSLSNRSLA